MLSVIRKIIITLLRHQNSSISRMRVVGNNSNLSLIVNLCLKCSVPSKCLYSWNHMVLSYAEQTTKHIVYLLIRSKRSTAPKFRARSKILSKCQFALRFCQRKTHMFETNGRCEVAPLLLINK